MKTIEVKLYSFPELSETAKSVALEYCRDLNVDEDDWYEHIFANKQVEIEECGFQVDSFYFRGFWSQGDGAMFTYSGLDSKLMIQAIDSMDLPEWKKKILRNGYLSGKGSPSGNYSHEHSCSHQIYFEPDGMHGYPNIESLFYEFDPYVESYIKNIYVRLCRELYRELEEEYDSRTSDESVEESIVDLGLLFYEDGELCSSKLLS